MATISRTGITAGGTISPTHITNIIDALDGTGIGITVVATGSFTGSLVGNATTATTATSASYALNATSASYVAYASSFPYTGSAIISGSALVTGSLNVSGSARVIGTTTLTGSINVNQTNIAHTVNGTINGDASLILNLRDVGKTPASGSFVIPNFQPGVPSEGTIYWDVATRTLNVYSVASGWTTFNA